MHHRRNKKRNIKNGVLFIFLCFSLVCLHQIHFKPSKIKNEVETSVISDITSVNVSTVTPTIKTPVNSKEIKPAISESVAEPEEESVLIKQTSDVEVASVDKDVVKEVADESEEFSDVEFWNAKELTSNPWKISIGYLDSDNNEAKRVLVTPSTSLVLGISEVGADGTYIFKMQYGFHELVSGMSDGADLSVNIYEEESETLLEQRLIEIGTNDAIGMVEINLRAYEGKHVRIQIECGNGSTDQEIRNSDYDWVVLENISLDQEYIKAVHYFGDQWPINFWNTEMDNLSVDFQMIKEDGFNSIILVLPWREFQPTVDPVSYTDYTFEKLDEIMKEADQANLNVYLRLGYSWDFYENISGETQARNISIVEDIKYRKAWMQYLEKIYNSVINYQFFRGAFITWEDFWDYTYLSEEFSEIESLIERANASGFHSYLQDNYTLDYINATYRTEFQSIQDIPLPTKEEPFMELFYEFYDDFLINLLKESQSYFKGLSMEVRSDWDAFKNVEGEIEYYKHKETYSCGDAKYISLMYGIYQGCENIGEKLSYKAALQKTEYILSEFYKESEGKEVFVEQFNFTDNTPAFKKNAQIAESELNLYLENVSDILKKYSSGYGIWSYRDYRSNMIYNPEFALGNQGWEVGLQPLEDSLETNIAHRIKELCKQNISTCEVVPLGKNDTAKMEIDAYTSLSQCIQETRNHFPNEEYILEMDIYPTEEGYILMQVGNQQKSIVVDEAGRYKVNFDIYGDLKILSTMDIQIDNVNMYSHIQSELLYSYTGDALMCTESIRILNKKLS